MKRMLPLLLIPALLLGSGCTDSGLAGMTGQGGDEILRSVNSPDRERRVAALRLAASGADVLRRRGDAAAADELDNVVIRRYFAERDDAVRAVIVRVCAPAAGRSAAMARFLQGRIAEGEFPGYAALSLAVMAPRSAYPDIEPLTRHPAPDVRLQAATALTVLGDPRGFASVRRVRRGMEPGLWPDESGGVPLAEARAGLEARALRAFGRAL